MIEYHYSGRLFFLLLPLELKPATQQVRDFKLFTWIVHVSVRETKNQPDNLSRTHRTHGNIEHTDISCVISIHLLNEFHGDDTLTSASQRGSNHDSFLTAACHVLLVGSGEVWSLPVVFPEHKETVRPVALMFGAFPCWTWTTPLIVLLAQFEGKVLFCQGRACADFPHSRVEETRCLQYFSGKLNRSVPSEAGVACRLLKL